MLLKSSNPVSILVRSRCNLKPDVQSMYCIILGNFHFLWIFFCDFYHVYFLKKFLFWTITQKYSLKKKFLYFLVSFKYDKVFHYIRRVLVLYLYFVCIFVCDVECYLIIWLSNFNFVVFPIHPQLCSYEQFVLVWAQKA